MLFINDINTKKYDTVKKGIAHDECLNVFFFAGNISVLLYASFYYFLNFLLFFCGKIAK